jgi:hypothetical protein
VSDVRWLVAVQGDVDALRAVGLRATVCAEECRDEHVAVVAYGGRWLDALSAARDLVGVANSVKVVGLDLDPEQSVRAWLGRAVDGGGLGASAGRLLREIAAKHPVVIDQGDEKVLDLLRAGVRPFTSPEIAHELRVRRERVDGSLGRLLDLGLVERTVRVPGRRSTAVLFACIPQDEYGTSRGAKGGVG